jgi:hypothetical protein
VDFKTDLSCVISGGTAVAMEYTPLHSRRNQT